MASKSRSASVRFPSIKAVASALVGFKSASFFGEDVEDIDVRLQVTDDGNWELHTGDAQYDTDHRGYWGANVLTRRSNCRELASELIDEARDHYAQTDGADDKPTNAPTMPTAEHRTEDIPDDAVMLATADDIVDPGEADTVLLTPEELPTVADIPPAHVIAARCTSAELASKLDAMTAAYVECALWTETDDEGDPLDRLYTAADIHPDSFKRMQEDCEEFALLCEEDIARWEAPMCRTEDGKEAAGHDFWLTRNRHGSGFGDGDWPEGADKRLYDASKCYLPASLYVGDDGYLHYFVG